MPHAGVNGKPLIQNANEIGREQHGEVFWPTITARIGCYEEPHTKKGTNADMLVRRNKSMHDLTRLKATKKDVTPPFLVTF